MDDDRDILVDSSYPDVCDEKSKLLMDRDDRSNGTSITSIEDGIVDKCVPRKSSYNPGMNRAIENPTSNLDTMIHLLKGNIGTGILAMPDAFRNSGWLTGIFGTLLMSIVCTHSMHILLKCSQELCRRSRVPTLGYATVAEVAFSTGPPGLRKYSSIARIVVNTFLVLTQIGFCCVYFVFVASNLQEFIGYYFHAIDVKVVLLGLLLPLMLLNSIKTLKYLTPASFFASILTVIALAIIFYYLLRDLPKTEVVYPVAPLAQLPLYFGIAVYAFEGIGVVLPLENNMENPDDLGGISGVLNRSMVIVTLLYISVGFFGYLRYGDRVAIGSITLNLPPEELLAQCVRVFMALAIFLSYALQFYVPISIIWPRLSGKFKTDKGRMYGEYAVRALLVIFTFFLAIIVPNLSAVISLVGSVSSSALALIFPPLLEITTFWQSERGLPPGIFLKDISIALFGLLGFVAGSYTSLVNIISS